MLSISSLQPGRILATGIAVPESFHSGECSALDNEDVLRIVAPMGRRGPRTTEEITELAEMLSASLGVKTRYWSHKVGTAFAPDAITSVDLQHRALVNALQMADLPPQTIGVIIAATSTPARATGANAPTLAHRLGLRCAAFDVRAGCTGGLLALIQGYMWAQATQGHVAVVAGDTFSKLIPPNNPTAALAFGDGAGAVIISPERNEHRGLLGAALASEGGLQNLAAAPAPFPPTQEAIHQGLYFLAGSAQDLMTKAPALYVEAIDAALDAARTGRSELACFLPHQSGKEMIESVRNAAELTGIPAQVNIEKYANTGAGSILMALHERLSITDQAPKKLLLAALGGGLCWGAAVIEV